MIRTYKTNNNRLFIISLISILSMLLINCSGENESDNNKGKTKAPKSMLVKKTSTNPMESIGIGPIKNITLAAIDDKLVAKGKEVYEAKCTACHKIDKKYIGPRSAGLLERRSPEWIMNMILNPEEMVKKDPVAIKLFEKFLYVPMANQNLTEDEARAVLEYFRTLKDVKNN